MATGVTHTHRNQVGLYARLGRMFMCGVEREERLSTTHQTEEPHQGKSTTITLTEETERDQSSAVMALLLEVEQKFSFHPGLRQIFHANRGRPAFSQLRYQGQQRFVDRYYDRSRVLEKQGVWIRERDGRWEAKRRVQGDLIKTAFEEIHAIPRIHSLICQHLPGSPPPGDVDGKFGLDLICRFQTTRHTYTVDERFSVVLDETDFGHHVGEIELMTDDVERGQREIEEVLTRYSWFFCRDPKPKGKLTAYFEKFGKL